MTDEENKSSMNWNFSPLQGCNDDDDDDVTLIKIESDVIVKRMDGWMEDGWSGWDKPILREFHRNYGKWKRGKIPWSTKWAQPR